MAKRCGWKAKRECQFVEGEPRSADRKLQQREVSLSSWWPWSIAPSRHWGEGRIWEKAIDCGNQALSISGAFCWATEVQEQKCILLKVACLFLVTFKLYALDGELTDIVLSYFKSRTYLSLLIQLNHPTLLEVKQIRLLKTKQYSKGYKDCKIITTGILEHSGEEC